MQEVKVVARTFEVKTGTNDVQEEMNNELTLLAGKAAGVCYMPDDYMENGIQNKDRALARAEQTSESGHHSVYDHGHITFVIKTNKMMAMILNSLGVYATSEKSARYTKMQPETELELKLYEKWKVKIKELILTKYPDMDDDTLNKAWLKQYKDGAGYKVVNGKLTEIKPVLPATEDKEANNWFREKKESMNSTLPSSKLAQENARYMISVFTPTTMMYTISFRQAFLTMDYLYDLAVNLDYAEDNFSKKLKSYTVELWREFEKALGEIRLHDNKNQNIRFLEAQHVGELDKTRKTFIVYEDLAERIEPKKEVIGDSYTLVYHGSLAMLAQAQRHRTLRYSMLLQDAGKLGWYVPDIIKEFKLENEWLDDISSVAYCIPQGTVVRITEQGLFEDFALKCKERMCGRAQLEIMKSTTESVKKFIGNMKNLSYSNKTLLNSMTLLEDTDTTKVLTPCARCKFTDFKCTEGCQWGPKGALTRLV